MASSTTPRQRSMWQRLLGTFETPERQERATSVLVIGLGRFGASLAESLLKMGTDVLAIDLDMGLVQRSSATLPNVRQADATNPALLEQLGAREFSVAVVAIGTGIEASVLSVVALLEIGVSEIWAKAISDEHAIILERVGAHHIVSPEREMGERVAHAVSGQAIDYFELDDGFALAEIDTPTRYIGQSLFDSDIRSKYSITVVCVKPDGGRFTYATTDTVIGTGDILVVAGATKDVDRFADLD